MRGDKLVLQEWHRVAADRIAGLLMPDIGTQLKKFTISVAGESGVGKSEVALALADALNGYGIASCIVQQDDYFVYPPKTNADMRIKDIRHIGLSEVQLELLDQHLGNFIAGMGIIKKPLVIFEDDRITAETLTVERIQVMIVEGTYTTILKNLHRRIFIDLTYEDTRETRIRRNREKQDDFLEKVLRIEHDIISSHKSEADIVITRNHEVRKVNGQR